MENAKPIVDVGLLALVTKEESVKGKKSKEKELVVDSDSYAKDEEFASEKKALTVNNPKKFFKKKFQCLEVTIIRVLMVAEMDTKEETKIMRKIKVKESRVINTKKSRSKRNFWEIRVLTKLLQ